MIRPATLLLPFVALIAVVCPLSAQHRRAAGNSSTVSPAPLKDVIISFHGTLAELSKKDIQLVSDDNKLMIMRRSSKTKFLSGDQELKAKDVDVDDKVTIDAVEDNDMKFLAVAVHLDAVQPPKKDRTLIAR
jgi:hypothetical protein